MKKALWILIILISVFTLMTCASLAEESFRPDEVGQYLQKKDFSSYSVVSETWSGDNPKLSGDGSWFYFVALRNQSGKNRLLVFQSNTKGWKLIINSEKALNQSTVPMLIRRDNQSYDGINLGEAAVSFADDNGSSTETVWSYDSAKKQWRLKAYVEHDSTFDVIISTIRVTGTGLSYTGWRTEERTLRYAGTVQDDLKYFSYAAFPKTIERLEKTMTVAPTLPEGTLSAQEIKFTGGKKYEVYSGPGKEYLRGANGKASVSTNDWIQVFGQENDWIMIQYAIDSSHYRIGYISQKALPKKSNVTELSLQHQTAYTANSVYMTDDPLFSTATLTALPSGTEVALLGTLGEWAYIENQAETLCRGFVPMNSLSLSASTFATFTASNGAVYDWFTVTKLHYDYDHHVNAVSGYYERFVPGEESDGSEKAEGSEKMYSLASDFHADMINSMTEGEINLVPVTDLHQWYVDAYIGRENYYGNDFIFTVDYPDGYFDSGIVEPDFWFVTTQIELNDRNEIQYMKYVYVPWG